MYLSLYYSLVNSLVASLVQVTLDSLRLHLKLLTHVCFASALFNKILVVLGSAAQYIPLKYKIILTLVFKPDYTYA